MTNRLGASDPTPTLAERRRLWSMLDVSAGADGCWPCGGRSHLNAKGQPTGYRRLRVGGMTVFAHRAAYRMAVGPIPDTFGVLHRCDNPPCCNPRHLFTGTERDNSLDAFEKGRLHQIASFLYADEVAVIQGSGDRPAALAHRFGVSVRTIYRALKPSYAARPERFARKVAL